MHNHMKLTVTHTNGISWDFGIVKGVEYVKDEKIHVIWPNDTVSEYSNVLHVKLVGLVK